MYLQSFKRSVVATATALVLTASFVAAQDNEIKPEIKRPRTHTRENTRVTPSVKLDKALVFDRIGSGGGVRPIEGKNRLRTFNKAAHKARNWQAAAIAPQGFGTGSGDIFEVEPNNQIAQNVSLPVNVFGEISFDGDVDFFAFQGLAGQTVAVEPFAARLRNSDLIADIALFDSAGRLITSDFGDEATDPLIRFTPSRDEVLIVGIADAEDFGGRDFDYVLNITRGSDVDEVEPNGTRAQSLPQLPVTVFGEIEGRTDVDFYSFFADSGQTLIVDVDSEVFSSGLDPEINLSDPETGVEYIYNDQSDGDDSRFNIVLPYTGRYVIGIGSFDSNSDGFYRLNVSLVSSSGAPVVTGATKLSKKFLEVTGTGFTNGASVEINGRSRKTTFTGSGTLRAKVKTRAGDVVTVIIPPDQRRSNPLILQ
ncbi:MAG TPA: PPC domain-containing protein [Blastocatellia bacterium]|nr:PPC domain-containing protein [Blastocatellia bacterium]